MRFHKDIEPKEKERLENLVELIKNCVEKNDYEYTEQLGSKQRTKDLLGQKIYKVEFEVKEEETTYLIAITKLSI
jgi:hypothetical protein